MIKNILRSSAGSAAAKSILTLVACMATTPVSAEDGKVYPASFCADAFPGSPPYVSFNGNGVINTSASYSAVLICPTVKDNIYATSGINEANLRYYKPKVGIVLADLTSYAAYGSSVSSVSRHDDSESSPEGYKTFTWPAMTGRAEGYYVFTVVLGNSPSSTKAKLVSYRIDEND
jgi:hypothetical protein